MFYLSDGAKDEINLTVYRNLNSLYTQDFPLLEHTHNIASNVINFNKSVRIDALNLNSDIYSNSLITDKYIIGIPINDDNNEYSIKSRGAVLLWTACIDTFYKKRHDLIMSMSRYISRFIEWNITFEEHITDSD